MPFGQLNLNDLVALDALLAERHVTRAAQRIGVSQSAMSHTLRRLRRALGDPLLVRGSSDLVLTPRARGLSTIVRRNLAELERSLFRDPGFDPATSDRQFAIACLDLVVVQLLAPLMSRLEREAPGVRIIVRPVDSEILVEQLESDRVDVAIIGPEPSPGMRREPLFGDRMVCAVRRGHPATRRPWNHAAYRALRHAVTVPPSVEREVLGLMATQGIEIREVLRLPTFVAATMVIADSDLALTGPRSLMVHVARRLPIQVLELPLKAISIPVSMVWHPKDDTEPSHQWLRDLIREILEQPGQRRRSRRR
ncbi:MAG TPA: LysR family transcriptional regulator [Kofleriaceae bacterium]|nr:LysR family transcriptional regulator [Kofleriaceae bacterium]